MGSNHRHSDTNASNDNVAATDGRFPDETTPVRTRRFKRSGQPKASATEPRPDSIPAMLAELMLLREENAWLKAAQHQPPGVGRVIERARAVPAEHDPEDNQDDATQVLVEAHVLRESLMELTGEIQRAMARVQVALEALSPGFAAEQPDDQPEASVIQLTTGEGNF